jgi:hypothetical protein
MARTSYNFSAISWREQVTIFQLYHGENKLQFLSYIMARTSYNFSAISWREQVTIFQLYHGENKLHFLAHLAFRPCELLSSPFVRCPSVNISHFNLLLRNHWANCNQTLVERSLDGPLSKLCPVIPTSNQDGRQAKNRKKGG